jgi:hypothetical protein
LVPTKSNLPSARAAWAKSFAQETLNPAGLTLDKLDLRSGKHELWQVLKPKDQVGLRPMIFPSGITPDGGRMVVAYGTQLGQLYRSDTQN